MTLPSQPVMGLIDGMEILQFLASAGRAVSGLEVSETLGIEKTKVSRVLKTLSYLGFTMPTKNRQYTLGPAVHVLSAQLLHGTGLIKNALKYLIELTELEVVVAMGVLWHDKVSYTYHWEPGISPTDGLGRVSLFPASQSSIGLVLYSKLDDAVLAETFENSENLIGYNELNSFMDEINKVREKGYATTYYEGEKSMAVALGKNPAYASIALAHLNQDKPDSYYLDILKEKAKLIEAVGPNYQK